TLVVRADIATCVVSVVTNSSTTSYPNSSLKISVYVRNDGDFTWTNGQWGLQSKAGETNNFETNGGGAIAANWTGGGPAGPGTTVEFTRTVTLPGISTYSSYWEMQ